MFRKQPSKPQNRIDSLIGAGTKIEGNVNFSANSFEGDITANSSMGGQAVVMQNRVSGRRLGGC